MVTVISLRNWKMQSSDIDKKKIKKKTVLILNDVFIAKSICFFEI